MITVRKMVNNQFVVETQVFNSIDEVMAYYIDDDLEVVVDPSSFLEFTVNGKKYAIELDFE